MKEIFLSFRPEYFKPLLYGIKKYEYRKIKAKRKNIDKINNINATITQKRRKISRIKTT